jgi:hypothetical protein
MLPPANHYAQGGNTSPNYQQGASQRGNDNDNIGNYMMPMMGGAALGVTTVASYEYAFGGSGEL